MTQIKNRTTAYESETLIADGGPMLLWARGVFDGATVKVIFVNPFDQEDDVTDASLTETGQKIVNLVAGNRYKIALTDVDANTRVSFGIQ